MTAKEQLLAEAPSWSEDQAERALRAAHGAGEPDPERTADEWGDLSAFSAALTSDSFRRLDEEERAAGLGPWQREPNRHP